MSLGTDDLERARTLLESLNVTQLPLQADHQPDARKSTEESPPGLVIDLKGLESMHSPEKTSILYVAPVERNDRLYPFCLKVQELFKREGLLIEDDRKLKLHATIVNTIYAKGRRPASRKDHVSATHNGQGHGPHANAPLKLDARAILDEYRDFVWAKDVHLDRVAICEMGAKKLHDDQGNVIGEQYTEVASMSLSKVLATAQ